MMQPVRTVLVALRAVMLVVLLVMAGAMFVATVPVLLGHDSTVVTSDNMQPGLQFGDLLLLRSITIDEIHAGDVVVYRTPQDPSAVIVRRVLFGEADGSGGQKLQVRGDSEPSAEQIIVQRGSTLGRLELSVPRIGYLVSFGNSLAGRALLLGLPAVLLALDQLRKRLGSKTQVRTTDMARVAALLESGQRALAAGFPELALRAAVGALKLDPQNAAATLLERVARSAMESDRARVPA